MMKKVLLLSNHYLTLFRFRTELIDALILNEYDVHLAYPKYSGEDIFVGRKCSIYNYNIDRHGVNIIKDYSIIRFYRKLKKTIKPDYVLSFTIKPNIYGSYVFNNTTSKQACNITGTGNTFQKGKVLSFIIKFLYKRTVKKSKIVFFQNLGDKDFFIENRLIKSNYTLIPGSGVNLDKYSFQEKQNHKDIRFLFLGRVMKLKGIELYLDVAKILNCYYDNLCFDIAGFIEEDIYEGLISECDFVNYLGFVNNVITLLPKYDCIILPSFGGEGVPNALLEAAALGIPSIASNIPGSNQVVIEGETGFLFKNKSAQSLQEKVELFINLSSQERKKMAINSRLNVEQNFDRNIVIDKYLDFLRRD